MKQRMERENRIILDSINLIEEEISVIHNEVDFLRGKYKEILSQDVDMLIKENDRYQVINTYWMNTHNRSLFEELGFKNQMENIPNLALCDADSKKNTWKIFNQFDNYMALRNQFDGITEILIKAEGIRKIEDKTTKTIKKKINKGYKKIIKLTKLLKEKYI